MLIIKTKQRNSLVVTVSQNSTIPNPEWLFSFTHIFSKQQVRFIPTDISTSRSRYDEFEFIEGQGVGEIPFPYEGLYNYAIYQQPAGSGNLNPSLSDGAVEYGQAVVIVVSADTTNDYYVEFISDNEFNSNYIFAPNELNPPPVPSSTPTNTPTNTSTPTNTPTNTSTPTNTPSETATQTPTPTTTLTSTPTQTETGTPTPTPTNTTTQTQTPTTTTTLTASPTQTNTSTPTPTPTITQTQTPTTTTTLTASPTQTLTATATQTLTPTQTPTTTTTLTASPTPTNTATPTNTTTQTPTPTRTSTPTPSITPNPVCPEQFVVSNSPGGVFDNGTYQRMYSSSGQSFNFGYVVSNRVVLGTAPNGNNYPIFEFFDGGDYNTVYALFTGSTFVSWRSIEQNPSILTSGSTFVGGVQNLSTNSINFGGVLYPPNGQVSGGYITYPLTCPTPTPTNTQTQTPTTTTTSTNTPTPSATPQFLPSNIANLYQWFDTSVGSNITTRTSGGETFVESWTGRTGGYFVSQTTAANQPKLVAGAFGFPFSGITFSGGTDFLSGDAGNVATPTGNTTFIVARIADEVNALMFDVAASGGTSETTTSLYINSPVFPAASVVQMRSVGGSVNINNWNTRSKYPKLLGATSGNTSTRSGMFNDIAQTSTGTFTSGNRYATIRFSTDTPIAPSNGTIFEVLVYNRVLTQTEANNVLTYLKSKWDYDNW